MKKFNKYYCGILILGLMCYASVAQTKKPGERIAATVMQTWKDSFSLDGKKPAWSYDLGVILKGMEGLWLNSGNVEYFNYIQKMIDSYVQDDGSIKAYKEDEYNIDHINNGKLVLTLYRITGKEKYRKAADLLRNQLRNHPRTKEGGFWHKKIYPYQMWLDGLYMGAPFYAEYAMLFHEDTVFNDVANQFVWMENHARDSKTGLLHHAWDESREQAWADKNTGKSPLFWSRAMGWYADAIVDALDYFPASHPGRKNLIGILNRLVNAIEKQQDPNTGLWYDIMDYKGPGKEKNYFETSASCQFVYAIAKGVRLGYLPQQKIAIAQKAWKGIQTRFIKEENGRTNLHGTVKVSGLGGKPYRDGSFEYYMSEPVIVNDPKGLGAFLLAAGEMDLLPTLKMAKGKVVMLDRYYNSEVRKDATGKPVYWHYVWDERSHPGFQFFGHIFKKYGSGLTTLDKAPTKESLSKASVYIIVDPDHIKDNPNPNYMTDADAAIIADWVKAGGVLLMMANDSSNCDLDHFNKLASRFSFKFNSLNINMVKNDYYPTGEVLPGSNNSVFKTTKKMFLKEICGIEISKPATALVQKDGNVLMSITRLGKGAVFAVGDPWLYNEYVDGRRLPAEYENYKAAEDLAVWLLNQAKIPNK